MKKNTIEEEIENNPQWGEEFAPLKLLHIIETYQHPRSKDLFIYMSQNDQRFYVNMPHNLIILD